MEHLLTAASNQSMNFLKLPKMSLTKKRQKKKTKTLAMIEFCNDCNFPNLFKKKSGCKTLQIQICVDLLQIKHRMFCKSDYSEVGLRFSHELVIIRKV